MVLQRTPGPSSGARRPAPTGSGPEFTDDPARLVPLAGEDAQDLEPAVRARARQIASRLSVPKPKRERATRRGSGEFQTVPYRGGSDEVDLDRMLEVLAENPAPDEDDIVVRERVRPRRTVVLAVDVSGSMKGERIRTAAATVGALAAELERDALGVVAFWSDAAVLSEPSEPVRPLELLDTLLKLPAKGLTNVAFPLQIAAHRLAGVPPRNARVVLLSDCVHNAGPDPRPLAARLPRLDVLLDVSGENDEQLGRELARIGRGALRRIRTFHDVAPALRDVFAD